MGDEIWKDVSGYEGFYQVSSLGRVRSLDRVVERAGQDMHLKGKIIRPYPKRGYIMVRLHMNETETNWDVHVLVARAFFGPLPDGFHTHHVNENKSDNRVENLKYVSAAEHLGIHHRGERAAGAKLTKDKVKRIKQLFSAGKTNQQISRMFDVHRRTIADIRNNKTWVHV